MQVLLRHDVNYRLMSEILGQSDEFERYLSNSRVVFTKLKRQEMWFGFIGSYENQILHNTTHNQKEIYQSQLCDFVVDLEKDDKFQSVLDNILSPF